MTAEFKKHYTIDPSTLPERKQGPYQEGSYAEFAGSPEVEGANEITVQLLPPGGERIVDLGTGSGAVIDVMRGLRIALPGDKIIGVDPDDSANAETQAKFYGDPDVDIVKGSATNIPVASGWAKRLTWLNSVHNEEDVEAAYNEMYRVLDTDGIAVLNSAYLKGSILPETNRSWGRWMVGAKNNLIEMGIKPEEKPVNLIKYSIEDHIEMAKKAGFTGIEAYTITAPLHPQTVRGIARYDGFRKGAFPGVDPAKSGQALEDAVPFMYGDQEYINRVWFVWVMRKAA